MNLKSFFLIVLIGFTILNANAQIKDSLLYNPKANAELEIQQVVQLAKKDKKHVLIQIGGNWCKWCIAFNKFCKSDAQIDSILAKDYIVYHLNYSKENKNEKLLSEFQYPQRFGFPVFVVLDENGKQIHTENSAYLEEGNGYSKDKTIHFLSHWNKRAVDPVTYKSK